MSLSSHSEHTKQRLHVCITGSSSGIGLAAAKRFLADGHIVYHACRTAGRALHAAEQAKGGIPMVCNLADLDSVQSFAKKLEQEAVRLDVLCLNAAVAPSTKAGTTPHLTKNGFEECIGVNHIGHFLLANLLYPKLKQDGGGRLVITASSVHDPATKGGKSNGKGATLGSLSGFGINLLVNPTGPVMVDGSYEFDGAKVYKDSKLCNILFCRQAAQRLTGIEVCCFNPGFIPTTGLFESLRREQYWKAQALVLFARISGIAVPVEVGGNRLFYMATTKGVPSGSYFSSTQGEKGEVFGPVLVSKEASNDDVAIRLWEKTMNVVEKWIK